MRCHICLQDNPARRGWKRKPVPRCPDCQVTFGGHPVVIVSLGTGLVVQSRTDYRHVVELECFQVWGVELGKTVLVEQGSDAEFLQRKYGEMPIVRTWLPDDSPKIAPPGANERETGRL